MVPLSLQNGKRAACFPLFTHRGINYPPPAFGWRSAWPQTGPPCIENSGEFPVLRNCGQWREYFLFIPERSCVLQAFLLPAFAFLSFYKNAIRRIPLQIGFANLPLQPLVSNLLPFFYARSRESVQDSCCPGSRNLLQMEGRSAFYRKFLRISSIKELWAMTRRH